MNERIFKAEMIIQGDDINSLSNYLRITRQTLSRKIKEGTFTQDEMCKIKVRWNMSDEKFAQTFTEGAFYESK